jgi:hypothetical protein
MISRGWTLSLLKMVSLAYKLTKELHTYADTTLWDSQRIGRWYSPLTLGVNGYLTALGMPGLLAPPWLQDD